MDKFLDAYKYPKLNKENIKHINRPIISNGMETIIKSLSTKKSKGKYLL
jgi:hypothetical protein